MMKTKGAHSGNNGTEDPSRAALARPISTASTQHASIAPSKVGNRNSPRLLTEVSWGASTRRVSHCDAVRTLPCFSGSVGCDGEGSMPDSFLPGDHLGRQIRITRRTSPSTSVGARAVGSGREGLYGRPRPVHLADILREHDHLPTPRATDYLNILAFFDASYLCSCWRRASRGLLRIY